MKNTLRNHLNRAKNLRPIMAFAVAEEERILEEWSNDDELPSFVYPDLYTIVTFAAINESLLDEKIGVSVRGSIPDDLIAFEREGRVWFYYACEPSPLATGWAIDLIQLLGALSLAVPRYFDN